VLQSLQQGQVRIVNLNMTGLIEDACSPVCSLVCGLVPCVQPCVLPCVQPCVQLCVLHVADYFVFLALVLHVACIDNAAAAGPCVSRRNSSSYHDLVCCFCC
jgi:hypothetical protein